MSIIGKLRLRREELVFGIAREVYEGLRGRGVYFSENWTPVSSLGQLRKVVGGRFDTLKEVWLASSLPLREHRGDNSPLAEGVNWEELRSFLVRKGYQLRRGEVGSLPLFYIRPHQPSGAS